MGWVAIIEAAPSSNTGGRVDDSAIREDNDKDQDDDKGRRDSTRQQAVRAAG